MKSILAMVAITIGLACVFGSNLQQPKRKIFKIERIYDCESSKTLPVYFNGSIRAYVPNQVTFTGNIVVQKMLAGPLQLDLDIMQCSNIEDCRDYSQVQYTKFCENLEENSTVWTQFFANFNPKLRCPMLPNTYTMNEAPYDLTPISRMSTERFVWNVQVNLYDGDEIGTRQLVSCKHVEMTTTMARPKSASRSGNRT